MRIVVRRTNVSLAVAATLSLAGCVQPAYPPPPIELQAYPPAIPYQTTPVYQAPVAPPPLAEPLPPPNPANDTALPGSPGSIDDTGAIPLQQMPPPAPDATTPADTGATPPPTAAAAPIQRTPTSGPGGNVPLEGFRPMRSQSGLTP